MFPFEVNGSNLPIGNQIQQFITGVEATDGVTLGDAVGRIKGQLVGSHCSGISVALLVGDASTTPGTPVLMPVEMTITESKTIKVLCRRERRKNPIIIFTLEKRMAAKPSFTLETKLSLTSS